MAEKQLTYTVSEDPNSAVVATLVFHPIVLYATEDGALEVVNTLNDASVKVSMLPGLFRRVKHHADGPYLYIVYSDASVIVVMDEGVGLVFELWGPGLDDSLNTEVVLYKELGIYIEA